MLERLQRLGGRAVSLSQRFLPAPKPVAKRPDALAVGLVGVGGIGAMHLAAIDRLAEVRLGAVSDAEAARARRAGDRYGIPWSVDHREVVKNDAVEAVVVAAPSHLHASIALEALEAGKHVLVEKPIALSVADADRMVERARERGLRLGVAHQFRSTGRYRAAEELIRSGVVGDILRGVWLTNAVRTQSYYDATPWRSRWEGGGGALFNQYVHDIDMLCGLLGEPHEVSGHVANLAHDSEVDDIVSGLLVFQSGANVVLQLGLLDPGRREYGELVGDAATIEFGRNLRLVCAPVPVRRFVRESPLQGGNQPGPPRRVRLPKGGGDHRFTLGDFARAVREGRKPLASGEEGRRALEVATGILVSSVTGQRVRFPLDRAEADRVLAELRGGRARIQNWFSSEAGAAAEARRKDAVVKEQLALLGGPRAVTVEPRERWPVPKERIKSAVGDLIERGVYTETGVGTTGELEKRFAQHMGARYCLAQNNGTSTLWAAYYALGLGPGDEVLHPAYTWICAVAPAVHLGAKPVFCEVRPDSLTIDPEDMERRITPRTKAVSVVHIHGNVCDMDAVMDVARRHNLAVLEDCSHCTGAEWDGRKVGTVGDVGCFSMQGDPIGGKPLAAGEAGLVVTNRKDLYERILFFGHLNRARLSDTISDPTLRSLTPTNSGIKFRPHPWAMAAALVLLESLDERNERRRAYRRKLYEALAELPGVDPLEDHPKAVPAGFHGGMHFFYKPDELGGLAIEDFVSALQAEGVRIERCNPNYKTHRLKLFAEGYDLYGQDGPLGSGWPGYPVGSLPVTEDVEHRMLALPTFIEETPRYSDQVILAFRKVSERYATLQTKQARVRKLTQTARRTATQTAKTGIKKILAR